MIIVQRLIGLVALIGLFMMQTAALEAAEHPRIALVMKSLANEFFQTMADGARTHQKNHAADYDLIVNGIKDETDIIAQSKLVGQAIAQHVDAIIIAPADSKALIPAIREAISKGILVINIDNRFDQSTLQTADIHVPFVGPDNRAGARLVGDYVAKRLNPGDKVAIIEGVSTTFNGQQRTLGFSDAMNAAGLSIASVQSGQWEIGKANAVAAAILREHPDVKALLCGNDNMALGAVAAVKSAGKTQSMLVAGYDNISAIKPLLGDGRLLATADQGAGQQAVFAIEAALQAFAKHQTQNSLDADVKTPVALITK
jgi:ribose transport system substrate-binding protein